jgi:hypothetical protein
LVIGFSLMFFPSRSYGLFTTATARTEKRLSRRRTLPGSALTSKRVRDLVLYIVIGGIVAPLAAWAAIASNLSHEAFITWVPFVGNTSLIFGYTAYLNRNYLRRAPFWYGLCILILVHTCLYLGVLNAVGYWLLAWWIAVVPIEVIAVNLALVRLGCVKNRADTTSRGRD